MAKYPDQTRNLNPIPEARAAMYLYGAEYSRQSCGSMDFWDGLGDLRQGICKRLVEDVIAAARKHRRIPAPQETEDE